MDKITGNYLTQGNGDFPLDCETLDYLQTNVAMAGLLGNIAGDKAILIGCTLSADGARRTAGYVFVRTQSFPGGEVLRFEGGVVVGGMYVKREDIAVTAQGYDYPKAYTRRTLAPGAGVENFRWEDFRKVQTTGELGRAVAALKEELARAAARFAPAPMGIVQLWAGIAVPDGYALCDGRVLDVKEYPELFAAIGTAFNTAFSAGGTRYSTGSGFFRLPDLRGRFVAGLHDSDDDYKAAGAAGGEKKHILTDSEMPRHAHGVRDYYYPEDVKMAAKGDFDYVDLPGGLGSGDSDHDNECLMYRLHDTEYRGGGAAHENRPPYYVLAYIMRLK